MNSERNEPSLTREAALIALSALYEAVDSEIAAHAPVCRLSSRCCRFKEYGHDLFVSALEAEYWVTSGEPAVSADDWRPGENCPWQSSAGLCTARAGRPLGCRVYFCDPAFAERMPEITERAVTKLKRITIQAGMAWDYRPAHRHLMDSEPAWRLASPERVSRADVAGTPGDVRFSGGFAVTEDP